MVLHQLKGCGQYQTQTQQQILQTSKIMYFVEVGSERVRLIFNLFISIKKG